MAHKHAAVIIAMAEGSEGEYLLPLTNQWVNPGDKIGINPISRPDLEWRIAPTWKEELREDVRHGKTVFVKDKLGVLHLSMLNRIPDTFDFLGTQKDQCRGLKMNDFTFRETENAS